MISKADISLWIWRLLTLSKCRNVLIFLLKHSQLYVEIWFSRFIALFISFAVDAFRFLCQFSGCLIEVSSLIYKVIVIGIKPFIIIIITFFILFLKGIVSILTYVIRIYWLVIMFWSNPKTYILFLRLTLTLMLVNIKSFWIFARWALMHVIIFKRVFLISIAHIHALHWWRNSRWLLNLIILGSCTVLKSCLLNYLYLSRLLYKQLRSWVFYLHFILVRALITLSREFRNKFGLILYTTISLIVSQIVPMITSLS